MSKAKGFSVVNKIKYCFRIRKKQRRKICELIQKRNVHLRAKQKNDNQLIAA